MTRTFCPQLCGSCFLCKVLEEVRLSLDWKGAVPQLPVHSVGVHIRQPSGWAAVPVQLLRDAFELQSNALDNCAAACVCKTWQTAVNSSCVPVLHLHIHDKVSLPSCLVQWRAYLAARSSIGELKLTAGGSAGWYGQQTYLKVDNHLNPLACVPADCNSLTVDENFAPFVGAYTEQPAKLQHLAIKYRAHPTHRVTPGRDPRETLNDLIHLTQLRSLKVEASGMLYGQAGLHDFPTSLTILFIGGQGQGSVIFGLPDPDSGRRQESECLRRLIHLEVHMCSVHIPAGSIAYLQCLTSLSLSHSDVGRDLDAVLTLTNLESLDLTGVMIPESLDPEEQKPWSRFEAWPALCVFKFANCWLIDRSTVLDIATVQEVLTDSLALGMETANIHLVIWNRHDNMLGLLASLLSPTWFTHIVDLRVRVSDHPDTALHLATIVNQLLEALLCLQSFQLAGGCSERTKAGSIDDRQARIVLGDGYSGQLKNLELQNMYCSTLDFEVATSLTSLRLLAIEKQDMSCKFILPSSVVRLEFYGNSLTTRHAKCLLEGQSSLTHLTLGLTRLGNRREPEFDGSACLPTMPSSLRWLSVTSSYLKELLDGSAQECLQHCTGLEYLILPLATYPKGELYAWVKGARYVRISDNDPDELLRWHNAYFPF